MRRIALLMICLCLVACHDASQQLRIGANRWVGYAPFYLADDLQWLSPSRMRLVEYPNSTGVLRAFRNGLLDAAFLTLDETLALQASGHDLEIVLVTDVSAGADALYALPPIRHLADLQGHRIGVENTALGAYLLARILDHAGLAHDDLQVVSLPVHEHVAALRDGRIDAVISFASEGPALTRLGARRIFDSRELPGEIVDVLVVDRQRVDARARQRLRALWYESLRTWMDNRRQADTALQRRLGLDTEAFVITFSGLVLGDRHLNRQWLESGALLERLRGLGHYMLERRLLERPAVPETLLARACGRRSC